MDKQEKKAARHSTGDRLAVAYCQILIAISVVIVFASFLDTSGTVVIHHTFAYSCFLFVVSIVFIIYLFITISMKKNKTVHVSVDTNGLGTATTRISLPIVEHTAEGMNKFLKAGMIVFGIGSVFVDVLRLHMFTHTERAALCYGWAFFVSALLRLLFVIAMSAFLLIHDRVVLNYHHIMMRFGMMHLVGTCVGVWADTVILEAAHAFLNPHLHLHGVTKPETPNSNTTGSNSSEDHLKAGNNCYRERTLYDELSPYLFPLVIEFALIGATIMYKINGNIASHMVKDCEDKDEKAVEGKGGCVKRAGGWQVVTASVTGILLFTAVFAGVVIFLIYEHSHFEYVEIVNWYIYTISDIVLNILAVIFAVGCLVSFQKMCYSERDCSNFDEILLSISFFGFAAMLCFRLVPEVYYASQEDGTLDRLGLGSSLLNGVQCVIQVAVIKDGISRVVRDDEQAVKKPGRAWLTLLLLLNLSMWLVNTFELKELYTGELYRNIYGTLAWVTIVHVLLPLAILFRYHSAVCLSDIWLEAYKREHMVKLSLKSMGHRSSVPKLYEVESNNVVISSRQ